MTVPPSGIATQLVHAGASVPDAQVRAGARAYQALQIQSQTLAYIDTFMVLCVGAAIMFCLSFVLKKNDPGGGGVTVAE